MLENSVYSVITPEGCAAILWKDASQRERAAEALKLTAEDLLTLKVIDEVMPGAGRWRARRPRRDRRGASRRPAAPPGRAAEGASPIGSCVAAPRSSRRWASSSSPDAADRRSPLQGHPPRLLPMAPRGHRTAPAAGVGHRGRRSGRGPRPRVRRGRRGREEVRRDRVPCPSDGTAAARQPERDRPTPAGEPKEFPAVLRRASQDGDPRGQRPARTEEEDDRRRIVAKVREHKLEMKVSDVEWQWDRHQLTVFFSAEQRVDFRALVRELASAFRTRIDLRQIGVRDEAARIGGVGRCGREYCCSTWLTELSPVNLSLAKDQHLSLNPSQISGGCGRLLCCLKYEHEFYVTVTQALPARGQDGADAARHREGDRRRHLPRAGATCAAPTSRARSASRNCARRWKGAASDARWSRRPPARRTSERPERPEPPGAERRAPGRPERPARATAPPRAERPQRRNRCRASALRAPPAATATAA